MAPGPIEHRRARRNGVPSPSWLVCGAGLAAAAVAASSIGSARAAASQDWPPFVLVTGLLLVGWVAEHDGLFAALGRGIARTKMSGGALFACVAGVVGVVTALLNLDTSVAFLTPVLIHSARSRGRGERPLLYGALLLSNAGSLLLPGSNLTNLIVLGHLRISGASYLSDMWAPGLAALVVTAVVTWAMCRRERGAPSEVPLSSDRTVIGVGLLGVVAVAGIVLAVPSPALAVAAVGILCAAVRIAHDPANRSRVAATLDGPLLVGLFGIAVGLGTLGRTWAGPSVLLSHLDAVGSAALAAATAVVCNNLPAASLLAARTPKNPFALLVGLNLGPNLCVTGSLAWLLWLRAARSAGARPSLRVASAIGAIAVPLSMAAALVVLAGEGVR